MFSTDTSFFFFTKKKKAAHSGRLRAGGRYSPQAWRVAGGQFAFAVGAQRLQRVVSYATHLQRISAPEGTQVMHARVSRGCDIKEKKKGKGDWGLLIG